jgi:YVTN family beta-propeller protein
MPLILVAPPPPPPTPTPTATATMTPTATPIPPVTVPVPGLNYPKDLAVNPANHRVYITSRDSGSLIVIDGVGYGLLASANVGAQPWGVAVNPSTNKVYVANFAGGDVTVLNATTMAFIKTIPVGPNPTFVRINEATNRVFVVVYGTSRLVVINGATDAIEANVPTGGHAAWGLAVNPNLNRVYVSNRDSGTITTLDGNAGWSVRADETFGPCGGVGASPYALAFNPANNKLYNACAPSGNVNRAVVFHAATDGLTPLAVLPIPGGGADGGGGIAIAGDSGNAFFTNAAANSVSVVSGVSNLVTKTWPAGGNPFGAAADSGLGRVFVGDRFDDNLTILSDYTP